MRRMRIALVGAAVALMAFAGSAQAQFFNAPVVVSPKGFTGLGFAAGYGRGVNDDSGKRNALFGTVSLGLPIFDLTAGVGIVDVETIDPVSFASSTDWDPQFMAQGALRVFGGPLIPVSVNVFAGAGYLSQGEGLNQTNSLKIPVGVGLAVDVPTPTLNIEPWIAPQVQITRLSGDGADAQFGESLTRVRYGASGGFNFGLPMGLGFWAAAEVMNVQEKDITVNGLPQTLPSTTPLTIALGLSYKFTLPSLSPM